MSVANGSLTSLPPHDYLYLRLMQAGVSMSQAEWVMGQLFPSAPEAPMSWVNPVHGNKCSPNPHVIHGRIIALATPAYLTKLNSRM